MTNTHSPDPEDLALVQKAALACDKAYAPYSNFYVGTAILLDNDQVITGANIENAAFPQCLCSEQVALAQKASLYPDANIRAVAVVARKASGTALVPVTPCGACRQVMLEFEARQKHPFRVIMQTGADEWTTIPSVSQLLPFGFIPDNLL